MNDIETYEQKRRRLFGRVHCLPRYLKELSCLLKRKVSSGELLSIVDTDNFIESTRYFANSSPDFQKIINFADKASLIAIIRENVSELNTSYMMSLSDSLLCGLIKLPSLFCFNFNFNFNDESAGLISFTRFDGEEYIVLDYYEEKSKQLLEIRIYKKNHVY